MAGTALTRHRRWPPPTGGVHARPTHVARSDRAYGSASLWWVPAIAVLLLFLPTSTNAQAVIERVEVYRSGEWLACEIRSSHMLDERIRSTVESGLPGACLYDLRLKWSDNGEVLRLPLEFSLRLDLWEENYYVEGAGRSESYASIDRADSAWAHLGEIRLVRLDELDANRSLELEVVLLVSPLGAEQRAWIDGYVSQANRDQRNELTFNLGGILKKVFGGGESGGSASARQAVPPFTVNALESRP